MPNTLMFFLLPTAAAVLWVFTWRAELLSKPYLIGAFVIVGVAGQFLLPTFSVLWFAAAFLNVGTSLYMAYMLKFGW